MWNNVQLYILGQIWISFVLYPKEETSFFLPIIQKLQKHLFSYSKLRFRNYRHVEVEYCAFGTNDNVYRSKRANWAITDIFRQSKAKSGWPFPFESHLAIAGIWKIFWSSGIWPHMGQPLTVYHKYSEASLLLKATFLIKKCNATFWGIVSSKINENIIASGDFLVWNGLHLRCEWKMSLIEFINTFLILFAMFFSWKLK